MRTDVAATVAVIAGLGLGVTAVMTTTGPADDSPAPSSPLAAKETTAPGGVLRTAAVPTLLPREAGTTDRRRGEPERLPQGGDAYGRGRIAPSQPTGIEIRRLGVDTTVSRIHAVSGSLVPPADYTTVGWWADGPAPGSHQGTAIITGHTVHSGGGAFDELGVLRRGDRVVIERARRDLEFVVHSVVSYEKGALAEEAGTLFAGDTPGRVALVTCDDWNGEIYLSNVVVIATAPQPLRGTR